MPKIYPSSKFVQCSPQYLMAPLSSLGRKTIPSTITVRTSSQRALRFRQEGQAAIDQDSQTHYVARDSRGVLYQLDIHHS